MESLVQRSGWLYRASKHQVRPGRNVARPSTSQGIAEPLCATVKGANLEVSEGKADLLPRLFSSYDSQQGAADVQYSRVGAFI